MGGWRDTDRNCSLGLGLQPRSLLSHGPRDLVFQGVSVLLPEPFAFLIREGLSRAPARASSSGRSGIAVAWSLPLKRDRGPETPGDPGAAGGTRVRNDTTKGESSSGAHRMRAARQPWD